ncbi:hypothetical protein [Candidatus Phytoplasma solani]|uniref:Uncharacterized protein n=1 Tax=Candidatus Phytoplasma solani TaxID=69896 RepID=A0A421NUT5_9MOLU|nr:hypothetical protein [Candidatus Phytoplasma solani]RMI87786.1 hypothetical protein PSSA1_v1c5550 [Candidatus Phytoplasma solani]
MELFKILTIIGILGIIFGLIPLWIWFIQKRENTNRIKKVNIKTALIVYYVMMSIIVLAFGVFLFLDIKYDITKTKPKIYPIPEPKIETHEEWFEAKGIRYAYDDENHKLKKSNELEYWFKGVKIEGTPMIKRTYTFYGLNGLGRGHHYSHEPTDLAPFVKNPFDNWYDGNLTVDEFRGFHTKNKDKDSQFNNIMIPDPSNHYIELNYKGPKWLLEEDKDYFMDEVNCPTNKSRPEGSLINKTYYLHFNPKQGYITLYTQKHNTKNEENK